MIVKISKSDFENIKNQFDTNPTWDSVITELNVESNESAQLEMVEEGISLSGFTNAGDM